MKAIGKVPPKFKTTRCLWALIRPFSGCALQSAVGELHPCFDRRPLLCISVPLANISPSPLLELRLMKLYPNYNLQELHNVLLNKLYRNCFLFQVLHYDVTSTGFTTALPYILSAIVKFIVGPISDRATCISDKWRLVLFAAASQGIMALAFLALVFVSVYWATLIVLLKCSQPLLLYMPLFQSPWLCWS